MAQIGPVYIHFGNTAFSVELHFYHPDPNVNPELQESPLEQTQVSPSVPTMAKASPVIRDKPVMKRYN